MRGSTSDHWRCTARPDRAWRGGALASARLVPAPFPTRVPPQLLERLRVAAPQLALRQGEIAAAAIDPFLSEDGF